MGQCNALTEPTELDHFLNEIRAAFCGEMPLAFWVGSEQIAAVANIRVMKVNMICEETCASQEMVVQRMPTGHVVLGVMTDVHGKDHAEEMLRCCLKVLGITDAKIVVDPFEQTEEDD